MIISLIILITLGIVSGFLLGKLHERSQWNDLLKRKLKERGIINDHDIIQKPPPKRKE